ncbi:MAG: TerB family tellurite resistance protein [Chitinophagales bacterium]
MEKTGNLLKDFSDPEKGAYLGAIASLATADHEATNDELEYIRTLAQSANLSPQQEDRVVLAAKSISADELERCLEILKNSDLRFSLIADIISFAKSDGKYSDEEKKNIEEMSSQLNISHQQFSLLDLFVNKSDNSGKAGEEMNKPGFITALGLDEKFKSAGINTSSLTKGLLGIVGPLLLAKMFSGNRTRGNSAGGMLGNPLSRGLSNSQPGIGSLISMLSGGRGYSNMGNIIPNLLRGRR